MRLLFDANLSPRLVQTIIDLFPNSGHVCEFGLGPDDEAIWKFAADNGFTIVSKDSDFYRFSMMRGAPPKVAWLRVGNAGTAAIASLIRARHAALSVFEHSPEAFLIVGED